MEILQAIPPLLEKVQAGFELTNKALACVRDQYQLQEQTQKDLAAFAAEYSSDKVSAKYSMAQSQGLKANLEQIEWLMMMMMRRLSSLQVRAKPRHLPYICIYIYAYIHNIIICKDHMLEIERKIDV